MLFLLKIFFQNCISKLRAIHSKPACIGLQRSAQTSSTAWLLCFVKFDFELWNNMLFQIRRSPLSFSFCFEKFLRSLCFGHDIYTICLFELFFSRKSRENPCFRCWPWRSVSRVQQNFDKTRGSKDKSRKAKSGKCQSGLMWEKSNEEKSCEKIGQRPEGDELTLPHMSVLVRILKCTNFKKCQNFRKCLSQSLNYLPRLQNIFVKIAKCICPNEKMSNPAR